MDRATKDNLRTPAATTPETYGTVAVRGMMWMSIGTIIARVAAFAGHWALGWLLAKDDFALYAIAISLHAMVRLLQDGGTTLILVQRGSEYRELARPMLQISAMCNLVASGALLFGATSMGVFFDAPGLPPLLWVIALSVLLRTPVTALYAKMSIDMAFRSQARIQTMAGIIRQATMVMFALLGFGPLSFVLPLLIVSVYELVAMWRVVPSFPREGQLTWGLFRRVFSDSRWVMLGALGMSFILQGDKLILGRFASMEILAVYFFGWQLTAALATPVSASFSAVLMPTLTKLTADVPRQRAAYLKTLRIVSFATMPFCVAVAIVADPIVKLLWGGKWDDAIPVIQILLLGLTIRLCAPTARSLIEARGRWRLRAILLLADSAGMIVTSVLGALHAMAQPTTTQAVLVLSVWMALYRVVGGIARCVFAGHTIGLSAWDVAKSMLIPAISYLVCGAVAYYGTLRAFSSIDSIPQTVVALLGYSMLSGVVALLLMKSYTDEVITMVRTGGRRPQ